MKYELKNAEPWPILAILILPIYKGVNLWMELLFIIFILWLFIINYKKVIITENNIYIEKYRWMFKKKQSYSLDEIRHVNLDYTKAFPVTPNIRFYFKRKKNSELVTNIDNLTMRSLYSYFKQNKIPIETKTPNFFKS
jgi:hypothetical protein